MAKESKQRKNEKKKPSMSLKERRMRKHEKKIHKDDHMDSEHHPFDFE